MTEWEVEYTDEFGEWWDGLTQAEQDSVDRVVHLLEELGPMLPRPYSDLVQSSQYPNMKELRVQHEGRPYRVLYVFDPRRAAILLLGGDKTGNDRWYEEFVPVADRLFGEHLASLEIERRKRKGQTDA